MAYLDDKGLAHLWAKVKDRSIPVKPVTKAQYDALPEEQKSAAVMYVVTDGGGSGSGGEAGGNIPAGGIIIWSGAADAVPEGWALCDGTNGTPDLRDRFVLGAGSKYGVGANGGEETHKLTTAEMPSHSHPENVYLSQNRGNLTAVSVAANTLYSSAGYTTATVTLYRGTVYTSSAGSNTAHNNMPPYYAMCYIMKL